VSALRKRTNLLSRERFIGKMARILMFLNFIISIVFAAHTDQRERLIQKQKSSSILSMPLIPYHIQRRRRRHLNKNPPQGSIAQPKVNVSLELRPSPLYQGYGTHFIDLWIGTPSQRQTVIVDTGSGITAIPCQDCINCGAEYHIDSYFLEDSSESFEDISCDKCLIIGCSSSSNCKIEVSYQEGSSWIAHEVSDIVYLGEAIETPFDHPSKDSFRLRFGCQTSLTGLFKTQLADGIMGMDLSSSSFWKQAYVNDATPNQSFSLCFSRQSEANTKSSNAGVMTMGGSDLRLHNTIMVYADQPNTGGYFKVYIVKIFLRSGGGELVASKNNTNVEQINIDEEILNKGDIMLDSGTTNTYLTTLLSRPFSAAWKKITGDDWKENRSVHLTREQLLDMPTILFQLRGWEKGFQDDLAEGLAASISPNSSDDILVAMPATHYMEYSKSKEKYFSRIYFGEGDGGVLGANFMMGHDILFDVDNRRIGFAESSCEYSTVAEVETFRPKV